MKVLVSEKLSEHKYKTPEGYLICTDAILARTGKQSYTKDELFQDGDNTEVNVDRPYDEVMNAKTIASFENKPITFDHPDEDVNVGNYKDYAIGYVRDVHQGKTDKGEDVILGNLVITDQEAINAIEQGDHTDLSCGYDCDIKDDGNGNYSQTNIRGNHLALCEQGRAGIAHIVDSKARDLVNDSKELVVGKWYDFAKKIEVARNQYATSLRISGKSGNVYRYTIYLKNGEVYGSGTYSEIKERFNIKDSKVDSKMNDDNLLGKRVRIRKRYSNLDGTIGTIYSYEGTNYNDEVEIKRNGHIYKVDYEDIEFLDSKVRDSKIDMQKQEFEQLDVNEEYLAREYDIKAISSYGRVIITGDRKDLQRFYNDYRLKDYNVKIIDNEIDDMAVWQLKPETNLDKLSVAITNNDISSLKAMLNIVNKDIDDYNKNYDKLSNSDKLMLKKKFGKLVEKMNQLGVRTHTLRLDSKEMTMSDAIKMLNIVDAYKRVKDVSTDEWVIKNTGLAYEVWNQGKMIKKFATKRQAIEWIQDRFPTDEITEDSTKDGKIWSTLTRKAKHR